MDSSRNTGGNAAPKPFKLPSRAELEERRKQLEANKPVLHFKPKGIAAHNATQSAESATNSARQQNANQAFTSTSASASASAPTTATFPTSYDTQNTRTSTAAGQGTAFRPVMPLSKTVPPQKQHEHRKIQQSAPNTLSDDDFGFGDDLGDIDLDDSLFDMSGSAGPSQSASKSKSTIVVKPSQRGNPLLQSIRNVPYEYGEIVPDFQVGLTSCIVFLSIRYHRLHPEYIFSRIAALGKTFVLRVLLVLVDVETHQQAIRELTRVAMVNDLTMICAWSNEEAARYIETFKAYENKAPDAIKERIDNDYLSKLTDSLTQVQSINKTDVVTLSSTFGSLKNIMNASVDELGLLPGFGERKVVRLLEAFDQPFAIDPKKRRHRR
ncbi:ssDNA endonuclease and repair protein rad10 [Mortierella alpina]|uniref:DNA excision repair protein ERCC-1 n=1 Tax=Mortierella alpina TaxID=64518 RepID=A0A9P6IW39_MORAP|nr:ssDNA endonuclease and repair protein rad10 [Mortierella alpina]